MIGVLFEVTLNPSGREAYLDLAAGLSSRLRGVGGFLSIERFQSLERADKLLSLSFWRDESAVTAWRADLVHREAQLQGRHSLFADYRLRVASVVRDYGMRERAEVPEDS